MRVFETIKPAKELQRYISYYYIDVATDSNYFNEYICYPHYNNTVSLYKSHELTSQKNHSIIHFKTTAPPLQIFTPVREETLKVSQDGPIHKIGLVFNPFGINRFLKEAMTMNRILKSPEFCFFDNEYLKSLFLIPHSNIGISLDEKLMSMLRPVSNP